MQGPHRLVHQVIDAFATGAQGAIAGAAGGIKGAGKGMVTQLEAPFKRIFKREGPLRVIDRVADGFVDATVNFASDGIIGSARIAGNGIMSALDKPIEQIGIPMGLPELPGFGRK